MHFRKAAPKASTIWRPRRDLNPCYRRESGMAKRNSNKLQEHGRTGWRSRSGKKHLIVSPMCPRTSSGRVPCSSMPGRPLLLRIDFHNGRAQPFQCSRPELSVDSAKLSSEILHDFALFIGAKMEPRLKNLSLPRFASISTSNGPAGTMTPTRKLAVHAALGGDRDICHLKVAQPKRFPYPTSSRALGRSVPVCERGISSDH